MKLRKHVYAACLVLLAAALTQPGSSHGQKGISAQHPHLVVHEWGTFTSLVNEDGQQVAWRQLTTESDLPEFVYGIDGRQEPGPRYQPQSKGSFSATVRMETPVIYFYTDQELNASVDVRFPSGFVTEWYPQAVVPSRGVRWPQVTVVPNPRTSLRKETRDSPYYHARETDSATLMVSGNGGAETEKFLFYRGVGSFSLPVRAALRGDTIELTNSSNHKIGPLFILEKRNDRLGFVVLESLDQNKKGLLPRPGPTGTKEAIENEIERALVQHGLFPREATAMVRTWANAWFEDGTRIFYIMPRSITDSVLPLTLTPAPDGLVRVLVARTDILTPEILAEMKTAFYAVPAGQAIPQESLAVVRRYRRFAEPILLRALGESGSTSRIQSLIAASDAQAR